MRIFGEPGFRQLGKGALACAAFSLLAAQPALGAAQCPDPATVSAAQLVEFQTMMMVVSLRCKHVGVIITDHNEDLVAARRTMFDEARLRVQRYVFTNNAPAPAAAVAVAKGPVAKAPGVKGSLPKGPLPKGPAAKASGVRVPVANGLITKSPALNSPAAKAAPAKAPIAAGLITKASAAKGPAGKGPAVKSKTSMPAAALKAASAPRSRRDDPFDQYLTRVGATYGMGSTTPDRCRQIDVIVMELADRTSPDRLLTMVAGSMIGETLLERTTGCSVSR